MPDTTYCVRFVHRDGDVELWEHTTRPSAEEHFNLFGADDADIYSEIQLIERRWKAGLQDVLLKEMVLN